MGLLGHVPLVISRSRSAALPSGLWLFLSAAPGEEGPFQLGSPGLLSPPQGFVLAVTIIREAVEEIRCYLRDKEVNSQVYSRLTARGQTPGPTGAASCRQGPGASGLQLNHGPLTVREQSSRPRPRGCVGAAWQTVTQFPAPGGPPWSGGPGGLGLHCRAAMVLLELVLLADLCIIHLE